MCLTLYFDGLSNEFHGDIYRSHESIQLAFWISSLCFPLNHPLPSILAKFKEDSERKVK